MEFCLIYPNCHPYCRPDLASEVACTAEEYGFSTFLIWDHYMRQGRPETLDAWTLLAYLAAHTSTIRLGTCVTPIPLRPPAVLAKQVATVDILSGGRAILGVGAGWHRPEFEGYSQWDSAKVRVDRVAEGLDLIIRLWIEKTVDFKGVFYQAKGAELDPKPVQKPHPPLWFGSRGARMLRLAVRHGDVWIPTRISPQEYHQVFDGLLEACHEKGKRPIKGGLQLLEPLDGAKDYIDSIKEYAEAGCECYAVVWSYPPEKMVSRIHWFSNEVMGRYL